VQLGAGVAKSLFDSIAPTTITWLRLSTSTVVLLAWARPRLTGRSRRDWLVVVSFGVALGTMNWAIYQSFARIPLGIAVTLEFIGPLALAVAGSHRPRDLAWAGLAAAGVLVLGLEPGDVTWAGAGLALLAGVAWAAYILLSRATGARWPGIDGLALASTIAAVLLTPLAMTRTGGLDEPRVLGLGLLVGVLSSVIPYSCELVALRTIRPAVFGILMSLEPAAAALAGLLVVHETLSALQLVAIACVIVASVGATRGGAAPDGAAPVAT
jgi:inner membrane transporter RhtA